MEITAQELSTLLNGTIVGNPLAVVSSVGKIEEAKAGELSFLANPKYVEYAYTTGASILIVNQDFEPTKTVQATLIKVKDAYGSFAFLLDKFNHVYTKLIGIEAEAMVHTTAPIGKDVYIGGGAYISSGVKLNDHVKIYPQVFIGTNVEIGEGTVIYPGVKIYHECRIGKNCIIHSGVIIGGDGFGHSPQADGTYKKVSQVGNVIVEDNVEIGANTAIDRATIGSTIIRKGVKLDNLIQIAHNVEIGENTVIAAQAGIAGSTKIGKNCMIGGQVGIVGHITIADRTMINAQSGVSKSITEPGKSYTGSPAYEYTATLRSQAMFRKLPNFEKRISELEALVAKLQAK